MFTNAKEKCFCLAAAKKIASLDRCCVEETW